jgi:hypothetical protein
MINDNEKYMFIVLDKEDNSDIKVITNNKVKAYEECKKCYDPQLEIWKDEKYINGCGVNEKASLLEIKELLSKYNKQDAFKFLDILNNSKVRYSFFANIKDSKQENIKYTVIKLPYDYISFYFSEETGELIKIENEKSNKYNG